MLPELPQRSQSLTLAADDWFVVYTDGLVESFDPDDELLDRAGAMRLLHHRFASAAEVVDALNLGEQNHRKTAEPHDDLTLLVFGLQ